MWHVHKYIYEMAGHVMESGAWGSEAGRWMVREGERDAREPEPSIGLGKTIAFG